MSCSEGFDGLKKKYHVLELYSGIGGMRFSLQALQVPFEIVAAIDVNPAVNEIYNYNFKSTHSQRNLLSFTSQEIDSLKPDIITMSPPCQPFTRIGLKKDIEDSRTDSFLHFLSILSKIDNKPKYLFLENVQGFESSQARDKLIETVKSCGYHYQEFLISPQICGVPNSRLRYYLMAKLNSFAFSFKLSDQILNEFPILSTQVSQKEYWKNHCETCCKEEKNKCVIQHFLEKENDDYFQAYFLPDNVLLKYWSAFDIVTEASSCSCCFTRAYGRYAVGTGSVLSLLDSSELPGAFEKVSKVQNVSEKITALKELRLRYFTPKEIANIMCFPPSFRFPENMTARQLYKSLGNSLNVFVVSSLLRVLLKETNLEIEKCLT